MNVIYLHGFASSPHGRKPEFFKDRFAERGITLRLPDLNVPDFEHLTLTAILQRAAEEVRACPPGSVYVIGSSLGGLTALHFVDRYRGAEGGRVERLFLLAPALDFAANRQRALGDAGFQEWHDKGYIEVFHYGDEKQRRVHYGLYEDMVGYDSFNLKLDLPITIYHGRQDESVDYQQSVHFAAARPNVDLHLVDSDHSLLDKLEAIWPVLAAFFKL
jgi:hypothetical protein